MDDNTFIYFCVFLFLFFSFFSLYFFFLFLFLLWSVVGKAKKSQSVSLENLCAMNNFLLDIMVIYSLVIFLHPASTVSLSFARIRFCLFLWCKFYSWRFFFLSFHHKFIVESLFLQKFFNGFCYSCCVVVLVLFKLSPLFYLRIFLLLGLHFVCRHRHFSFCCCCSLLSFFSVLHWNVSLKFSDLTLSRPIIWFYFIRTHYYCCESVSAASH